MSAFGGLVVVVVVVVFVVYIAWHMASWLAMLLQKRRVCVAAARCDKVDTNTESHCRSRLYLSRLFAPAFARKSIAGSVLAQQTAAPSIL